MKTLFPELSWKVAFRQFRRRGPAAPIRRRPPGKLPNLELVRQRR